MLLLREGNRSIYLSSTTFSCEVLCLNNLAGTSGFPSAQLVIAQKEKNHS